MTMTQCSRWVPGLASGLLLALLLLAPVPGFACGGHSQKDPSAWKARKEAAKAERKAFMESLGLSDEQKDRLKASKKAFKEQHKGDMAALKAQRQQLQEIVKQHGKDSPQATQLCEQMKASRQGFLQQREAEMRGILTPDQFARWQAHKASKASRPNGNTP